MKVISAIIWSLLASITMAFVGFETKLLGSECSVVLQTFWTGICLLLYAAMYWAMQTADENTASPSASNDHLSRGLIVTALATGTCSSLCIISIYIAFNLMEYPDAMAVSRLSVIFTLVIDENILGKKKFTPLLWLTSIASTVGFLMVVRPIFLFGDGFQVPGLNHYPLRYVGVLFAFGDAIFTTGQNIFIKVSNRHSTNLTSPMILASIGLQCSLISSIIILCKQDHFSADIPEISLDIPCTILLRCIFLSIGITQVISFHTHIKAIQSSCPTFVAIFKSTTVAVSYLLQVLFLNEQFILLSFIGTAIISISVATMMLFSFHKLKTLSKNVKHFQSYISSSKV